MRRILCVDDHVDSCELMKFILTDAFPKYRIDVAADPESALDLVSHTAYDLYLLDLWLPEMDGAELCRRIRLTGSESPVIFVSGAVRHSDKRAAFEAGGNGFLGKPFDPEELVLMVEEHLPTTDIARQSSRRKQLTVNELIRLAA